jgi:hypothetical protein
MGIEDGRKWRSDNSHGGGGVRRWGQVAVTLFAAVVAAYLTRLMMLYFP